VDPSKSRLGRKWTEWIDKEWLREPERKEREIGNLLEWEKKYTSSSGGVH